MNNVLVIGGSGFMGSHTADLLSDNGYFVTILDKVTSPWLRDDQAMVVGDAMDSNVLMSAMNKVDYVFYFAGIADIAEAKVNPYKTIEVNIMGLTKALEAGVKNNIKKFIYASTMYVYSAQGSFYIIEAYQENYQLSFVLLRYGSLYGPRSQNWNGIKGFARQVINHGVIEYLGNGSEIREYIHVEDAAKLSIRALHDDYKNKAITITGNQSMRVADMFSMLFEIAGKELNVKYLDEQQGSSHYGNTPYRYTPKPSLKIIPTEFIDLGQGLLNIVEEIHNVEP